MAELTAGELRSLFDGAPDAVIVVDGGGVIHYWNSGAQRIFGHAAGAVLGQRLDLIIPESLRPRHWEAFDKALATGESRYGPDELLSVPALTADGRRISIEFTVSILGTGAEGSWVAAVLRDVTERRAEDRRLRTRLAELENSEDGAGT
jgi:PAS domain S-box-containing protein